MAERRPLVVVAGEVKELPSGDSLPGGSGGGGVPDRSVFGNGDQGTVTISVDESLATDKSYDSLTIDSAAVLRPMSCIIRVKNTLDISNGTIDANGDTASGSTGGAQQSFMAHPTFLPYITNLGGTLGGGGGGGGGNSESYMGTPLSVHDVGSGYHAGGAGGASGAFESGGSGGARASHESLPFPYHLVMSDLRLLRAQLQTLTGSSTLYAGMPGTGGGGGGGMGGGNGGGGGASGGVIIIFAKTINIESGGMISANGGTGAHGDDAVGSSDGGGGGGGGGGSGGIIILVYESLTGVGAANIYASGGTSGNGGAGDGGGSGGSNGENGVAGRVIKYNLTTGAFE